MTDPVPTEAVARVAFLPRRQLLPTTLGTSGCVEAIIRVSAFDAPATVTVLFTGFGTGAVEANEKAIREMAAVLLGILPESEPEPDPALVDAARGGWCHCCDGRPEDCRPECWPMSRRHGHTQPEPEPRVTPVGPPLLCVVCMRQAHWKIDGTSYCREDVPKTRPL